MRAGGSGEPRPALFCDFNFSHPDPDTQVDFSAPKMKTKAEQTPTDPPSFFFFLRISCGSNVPGHRPGS